MTMPQSPPFAADNPNAAMEERIWTIHKSTEIPFVRNQCVKYAAFHGFDHKAELELSIAITELLTNALKFGTEATTSIQFVNDVLPGVRISVADNGPGFDNVEEAIKDGFSEGRYLKEDAWIKDRRGLGNGLGAVTRLTDRIEVSRPESGGTRVTIYKWIK